MLQKKWLHEVPYAALSLLIVFFLSTHAPNLDYDTPSYIRFDPIRPPLYPIFIWLFHWTGRYQFPLVMWVQSVISFVALLYARIWLRRNLKISDFLIFFVCLFVILTTSLHFQMWYIQAEGLTFPFFIWTFFLLIECFQEFDLKKISYLALWVGILVLLRLQFYYFYGIFILLCGWYLWKRVPIKLLSMGTIILLGSIALTTFIDKSYHYFKHGFFSGAPVAGVLLSVQPLFLADSNAASYFKNPKEKMYVQKIINQINQRQLNKDANLLAVTKPSYYEFAYESYARNYIPIQEIVGTSFSKMMLLESNVIAGNIAKTLVLHAFKRNLYFYCWKVLDFIGGIPSFLFFLLLFLGFTFKILNDKAWKQSLTQIFVTLVIIITFLNALLVATTEPSLPPYFCYSQFLLYCLAALIADRIFLAARNSQLTNYPP